MRKNRLFLSAFILTIGLLIGCNTNDGATFTAADSDPPASDSETDSIADYGDPDESPDTDGDGDEAEAEAARDGDEDSEETEKLEEDLECPGYCNANGPEGMAFCFGNNVCYCSDPEKQPDPSKLYLLDCNEECNQHWRSLSIACDEEALEEAPAPFPELMCVCAESTRPDYCTGACDAETDRSFCNGHQLCTCIPISISYPNESDRWYAIECQEYCAYFGKTVSGCIGGEWTLEDSCSCE